MGKKIRVVSQRILPKAHDFYIVQIGHGGRKPLQPVPPAGKGGGAVGGQPVGAAVQADQQRVAGGACLKHIQLPLHLVGVGQAAVQLQKGCLGQTGQGFVGALHHQICSGGYRAALPAVPGGKGQVVCPVGFVHQKRHIVDVANGGNGRNIAQNALVSRAGQNYAFCLRMGGQRRFHRGGRHTAVHAKGGIHRRGQVVGSQAPQLDGMVHGLVAVAGRDDLAAEGSQRADARQQAHGAAAHQIPAPAGTVQRGCAGHGVG